MSLKTLRYSHAKYCTEWFDQKERMDRIDTKKGIKARAEYENIRQNKIPKETVQEVPIEKVRMKTAKEKKEDKYNNMMENAF